MEFNPSLETVETFLRMIDDIQNGVICTNCHKHKQTAINAVTENSKVSVDFECRKCWMIVTRTYNYLDLLNNLIMYIRSNQ